MDKRVTIDGSRFDDMDGFYDEVERVLTADIDFKPGHNLNAFNDILRGGFGVHKYGEPITILWKNFDRSVTALGEDRVLRIIRIMLNDEEDHNCSLKILI